MDFFAGDAASDLFDLGRGEPAGSLFVHGLAQQPADQRGGGDLLGERAAAQLRVEFPVDA